MADSPKTRSLSLTNTGRGPRTFFDSDRQSRMIRPGETIESVEIFDADYESLKDLEASGDGGAASDASSSEFSVSDFEDLEGKDRDQLLAIANREGYNAMAADASEEDLRKSIEHARERNATFAKDLKSLKSKGRDALLKTAKSEGVSVETDDNRDQLALKIAQARQAESNKA